MFRTAILIVVTAAIAFSLRAETVQPNEPLIQIDEGKVYRVVNGEDITGRDILDVLVEEGWDKYLQAFVDYAIRKEEVEKAKIDIPEGEVDEELKLVLITKAKGLHLNPETLERTYGRAILEAFRRTIRVDLGLMKIFHNEKKLASDLRTDSKQFEQLKQNLVQRKVQLLGVEADPAKLGTGEAVRIGTRSYPRDEVRRFIIESEGQIPKSLLVEMLDQLKFEKLVRAYAKTLNLTLTDDDRKFQFSYMCRIKEQATGAPGRAIMMQIIQHYGMTPEQYLQCRIFTFDALATLIVKQGIHLKQMKNEFNTNPGKYKLAESLLAHIFVQVLDSDGHPYGPSWQATGHPAVNSYAAGLRESQFEAAKAKIDGLVPLAKENFDETARRYSDDATKRANGLIGRIGLNTLPTRPLDTAAIEQAVKLKPGEISAPVRSAYGWHIFKCLEKQDITFEEVEERVYLTLIYEGRDGLFKKLDSTAKIKDLY